jgi:hypothetical protein
LAIETLTFGAPTKVARWYIFKPKSQSGKFWRALELKMLAYFIVVWNILRPFGIFMAIW